MSYIADTFHLTPKKKIWIISQNKVWIADGPYDGSDRSFLFDDGIWYQDMSKVDLQYVEDHAYFPDITTAQQFAIDHDCTIADIVIV